MTPARGLVVAVVRAYQLTLSSLLGRQCRFLPTCSDYATEAIARHGVGRGGLMAAARVCRCHPWGGAGYDPVPLQAAPFGLHRASRPTSDGDARAVQDRASNCADSP